MINQCFWVEARNFVHPLYCLPSCEAPIRFLDLPSSGHYRNRMIITFWTSLEKNLSGAAKTRGLSPLFQHSPLLLHSTHWRFHTAASVRPFVRGTRKTDFSCKTIHFPPGIGKREKESLPLLQKDLEWEREVGRGKGMWRSRPVLCQVALLMRLILTNCAPNRVNLLFAAFLWSPT